MIKAFSLPRFSAQPEDDSDDDSELEDEFEASSVLPADIYDDITNEHIPCFAHTMQLAIKDVFKQASSINKVLSKASGIVSHVKKSIHSSEILESEKRLKAANVTRWNSQLTMIRSILNIPEEKLESLNTNQLTTYDRKILEDLVEILTPFETATQCIQGDKVITSSMVVPCVRVLKSTMENLCQKYTSKFVSTLKASVHKRLSKYEEYDAFLLASALDPRFKLKWCTTSTEYDNVKAKLIQKLDTGFVDVTTDSTESNMIDMQDNEPPTKKAKTFFSSLIDRPADSTTTDKIDELVEEYLRTPCLAQEEDPLVFWKNNQERFPALAKIAPNFLCIPASSAPVERLFSIAGKVFRPDRCRLTDKSFEELMFIRCNQ